MRDPHDPLYAKQWRRRHNYYLNCLCDVDRNIAVVLSELDAAGLADSTIVILTADHGDMDGAHQLRAKGAVSYRLLDREVGEDRGQMLPGGVAAGWEVSEETTAP